MRCWFHEYGKWTEPVRMKRYSYFRSVQFKTCTVCGKVKSRAAA